MHVKQRPCAFLLLDFREGHLFAHDQGLCLKITESRLSLDRFDVNGAGLGREIYGLALSVMESS